MGSFASFLCCGSEASHDSDETYQKQTPRNAPAAQTSQNTRTRSGASPSNTNPTQKSGNESASGATSNKASKPAKPVVEDDVSANESDTLSMANEEAKQLDNSNTVEGNSKESEPKANGASTENPQSADIPNAGASANESKEENGNSNATPKQESATDLASNFDLSAIQEHQSSNPETGRLLGIKDTARFGNKKCLVLDLDETLVHSSFKYLRTADFVIPVEIEDQVHHVYVIKRPGVDEFLKKVGQWYEVVVFTASVAKYGDPLLNKLDIHHAVHQRLFRDSCYSYQGNFIKNLSQLGRPLEDSIIIDNSPASYIFHPQHSVPISSWFSDTHDNELIDLLPLLEDLSKPNVDDVSLVLDITI